MASKRRQAKKEGGDEDKEDDKKLREAARTMFASLFLGGWDPSSNGGGAVEEGSGPTPPAVGQRRQGTRPGTDPATLQGSKSSPLGNSTASSSSSSTDAALGGLGRQVAEQVRNLIPEDRQKLRGTALYKEAYKGIQWQRDNYLVGREYANWRIKERYRLDRGSGTTRSIQSFVDEIQFDDSALAHPLLARLAAPFIPSDSVKNALLPLLLPVLENRLYPIAQQGLVHIVESQRDNLHHVLKGQILQFLSNPQNRANTKSSTRGYISTTAACGE